MDPTTNQPELAAWQKTLVDQLRPNSPLILNPSSPVRAWRLLEHQAQRLAHTINHTA